MPRSDPTLYRYSFDITAVDFSFQYFTRNIGAWGCRWRQDAVGKSQDSYSSPRTTLAPSLPSQLARPPKDLRAAGARCRERERARERETKQARTPETKDCKQPPKIIRSQRQKTFELEVHALRPFVVCVCASSSLRVVSMPCPLEASTCGVDPHGLAFNLCQWMHGRCNKQGGLMTRPSLKPWRSAYRPIRAGPA